MKELGAILCGLMLCLALCSIVFMLGADFGSWRADRELIKRGIKRYNTTTGVIEWVER